MKAISLFSGAGGFDYAARWLLGWRSLAYVEKDDYCQEILSQRIEDAVFDEGHIYGDIKAFSAEGYARRYRGVAQVVFGGPPCQPFSVAGKGLGWDDPRNLFPQVVETVRVVEPQYLFLENSPAIKSGRHARGFGDFLAELATLGYRCRQWDCLRACDVGAPHRRDRLWLLASLSEWSAGSDPDSLRLEGGTWARHGRPRRETIQLGAASETRIDTNSDRDRCEGEPEQNQRPEGGQQAPRRGDAVRSAPVAADSDRPEEVRNQPRRGSGEGGRLPARPGLDGELRDAADPSSSRQRQEHPDGRGIGERDREEGLGTRSQPVGISDSDANSQRRNGRNLPSGQGSLFETGRTAAEGGLPADRDADELGRQQRSESSRGRQGTLEGPSPPWTVESFPSPVAYGVASRGDKLRASGNGVVPLVAAVAWHRLLKGTR